MNTVLCSHCQSMIAQGVDIAPDHDTEYGGSVPSDADALEVFAPGGGHENTVQIRRCRDCGTFYRYRYHSEYDVSGSWDEYYFWQLSPAAQQAIGAILQSPSGHDAAMHAQALRHTDADVREDAALLLWIAVDKGHHISPELLATACQALADDTFLVGNYCYRALLSYGYRGSEAANALKAALATAQTTHPETRFGWILQKEFA